MASTNPSPVLAGVLRKSILNNRTQLFVAWGLYLVAMWMVLRPALLTTVTADDFVNPFAQAASAGFEPHGIWAYTTRNVADSGHFNYVGQLFGSLVVAVWSWGITSAAIHFTTVLAVTKFAFLTAATEVGARLVQRLTAEVGLACSLWRARVLLTVTFALFLQVHVPWSNDPVTSYPMAGYGSVVLGLALLLAVDRAVAEGLNPRLTSGLGVLAVLNVTYYELNVAAVGASAVLIGIRALSAEHSGRRMRLIVPSLAALSPSLIVSSALVVLSRPSSANYTGTSIALSPDTVTQAMSGVVSSLPMSSWHVAHSWLDVPVNLSFAVTRFLVIAGVSVVGIVVLTRISAESTRHNPGDMQRAIALSVALISYWLGATVVQSATMKVQDEARGIGYVYTFYAVGSVVVAVLLATGLGVLVISRPRVGRLVLATTLVVGSYQFALNSTVTMRFNEIMVPAQNLLNVYSEGRDEGQRCQALAWWKSMGWPEYYSSFTESGMNLSYQHYRGEPFCRSERNE